MTTSSRFAQLTNRFRSVVHKTGKRFVSGPWYILPLIMGFSMLKNASFLSCLAFFKTGWSSFLTSSTSLQKLSATPGLAPFLRFLMWALMNCLSWKKETFAIIGLGFDLCTVFGLVGVQCTLSNLILSTSRWEIFISFVRKRLRVSSVSLGDYSWLSFMPKNLILLRRVKHSRFIWRLSSSPTEASFFFASFNSADIDLTVPCIHLPYSA